MKKICSFCNTVINPGTSPEDPVSHGVCKSSYMRIMKEHGFNVKKFLDMLDALVFLVDSNVNILAANSLAIAAVKKPVSFVKGKICRDVIECVNAILPEGCGKTPFCPDCTIRSSVTETIHNRKTGNPSSRRCNPESRDTVETIHLLITTTERLQCSPGTARI